MRACNATGCGSSSSFTVTLTAPPENSTDGHAVWNAAGNGAKATWQPRVNSDGHRSTPIKYDFQVRLCIPHGGKSNPYSVDGAWSGWADGTNISNLNPDRSYLLQVRVYSASATRGPEINMITFFGKVRFLEAARTNNAGVRLTWIEPPRDRYTSVTRYEYRFQPNNGMWTGRTASGTGTSVTVNDLVPGQAYNFQVRAVSTGNGDAAHAINGFPAQVTPPP